MPGKVDFPVFFGVFSMQLRWALLWSLSIHALWFWDGWLPLSGFSLGMVHGGGRVEPRFEVSLVFSERASAASNVTAAFQVPLPEPREVQRGVDSVSGQTPPEMAGGMIGGGAGSDAFDGYIPTDRLTRKPRALSEVRIEGENESTPVLAGKVVMRLRIDAQGNVVGVQAEGSDFPEEVSTLFLDAFRRMRFSPGEIEGRPVAVVMRIEAGYEVPSLASEGTTAPVPLAPEK